MEGYYKDTTTTPASAKPCGEGMATCTDKDTALTCKSGWIILESTCVPCAIGDNTCTAKRATACNAGYFLSAGVCTACNSNSNVDACFSSAAS